MRAEIDEVSKETGHYAGLKELTFKESDPIRFEKIYSKLRGGVVHARETAKKVAASPIVEQEGELCFSLYTPEADSIVTSTGIIIHVGTMGAAIKFMIENDYENSPESMPMGPVQDYDDGYQITCRKIGQNDELSKDWLLESTRSVRGATYWTLDEKTRVAGCHMIRDLVLDVIEEEGPENYKKFIR